MKTREEIFKMINNNDYNEVRESLKEVCTQQQLMTIDALIDEFIHQSGIFNIVTFKLRFKTLVGQCMGNKFSNEIQVIDNNFYSALCKLDFKIQSDNFKKIYKHKKIAAFLLHGKTDEEENDLKWLYNQILYTERLLKERFIMIDCGSNLGGTFERLLGELNEKFEVSVGSGDNKPLAVLRRAIEKRLETGPFVCIIKNVSKFLGNAAELNKLFDQFLTYLNQEIVSDNANNSFILLFVDSNASSYKNQHQNYFFWFDELAQTSFSQSAVSCKDVRIIDLSPIRRIQEEDIKKWIDWSLADRAIFQQTSCFSGKEKSLLQDGDTPFQVIKKICETLNIKIDNSWIQ